MDKYEYRVKTEKMMDYVDKKQFRQAMEIADEIDWRRVKNPSMLNSVSEIYERMGEFKKSRDVLFIAYDRAPESRKTIYRLATLALALNDIEEASDCYEEYVKLAPRDPNQYILKYKILKARRAPLSEQIDALESFKKDEYVEKWAYELAKLYDEAGMKNNCIEECDDLILWFSEGKYVLLAMELKMKYKPLTPLQMEKYNEQKLLMEKEQEEEPVSVSLEETEKEPEEAEASDPVEETEEYTDAEIPDLTAVTDESEKSEAAEEAVDKEIEASVDDIVAQAMSMVGGDIAEVIPEPEKEEEAPAEEPKEKSEEENEPEEDDNRKVREESNIRKAVKGMTLKEALKNGLAVAQGIDIEAQAMNQKAEDMRITGQMKIDEILQAWEDKQKDHAQAIEEQKKKDDEIIAQKRLEAEMRREEEARRIEQQQRAAEEARKIAEQKAAEEAKKMAARKAEEERILAEQRAEEERRRAIEEAEREERMILERMEAEAKAKAEAEARAAEEARLREEAEARAKAQEEARIKAELEAKAKAEAEAKAKEEEQARVWAEMEAKIRAEAEAKIRAEMEAKIQAEIEARLRAEAELKEHIEAEEELREQIEAVQEEPVSNVSDINFEEETEDETLENVSFEEAFDEDVLDEDAYEEAELANEDAPEIGGIAFEEAGFYEDDDDEDFEFDEEEDDYEEADVDDYDETDELDAELASLEEEYNDDYTIEEPSEEEIQKRIKKGKGGVPFDTGFVVTGRYDLNATSEIGLRAGLTEEQKQLFSYFVPVRGMSEQIVEVLDNDRREKREGTSRTGNILVVGQKGSGKTVLAVDIVKAIQKQRNLKQGKVAIVTGESLNKKELPAIIQKLRGGAIIIEKAGQLNSRTVRELNQLMMKKTGELLVVLEDQSQPLEKLFIANPEFKKRFTSKLVLPVFINDELVTFGQTYAKENGYRLDEMGILALYSRIDVMQREDHAVSVAEVKEIMDAAIEHSQKANVKHFARRVFGKGTDESDRVILKEDDFRI